MIGGKGVKGKMKQGRKESDLTTETRASGASADGLKRLARLWIGVRSEDGRMKHAKNERRCRREGRCRGTTRATREGLSAAREPFQFE